MLPGPADVAHLDHFPQFAKKCPEQWAALAECSAWVNWLKLEEGKAPVLALYRPYRTEADIISLSTLTQLTDDPTLIRIHILLLVFAVLVAAAEWFAKHRHDREKPLS